MAWPPTVQELIVDMKADDQQARATPPDTARLQGVLDAAVAFVQRVRPSFRYDDTNPAQVNYPAPTADLRLGTLRLAARWHARRRSQDATLATAEFGIARVSSFDPDIDRLLRIGRHAKPRVA